MTKIQNPKRFEHLSFDIASNFDIRISNFIYCLLILFLPTQFGRHFWPDFSLVSGIRVDYLAPTLYLTDIFILIIFVFWLIKTVQSSKFKVQSYILGYWKLVVFVVFLIFGILLSKNQLAGLYGFLKLLEFIFLGFYTAYNFKKLRFDIVLVLISTSIIFESFLAIFQYINQTSIGGIFYYFGERIFNSQTPGIANASVNGELILRPYATFSHPNVLAGYLAIGMTMAISKIKNQKSKTGKIIFAVSLAVGTIAIFLTMSRLAILIWLITLGVFLFRKFLNHKSHILILLGALLILGLATPLGARFTELKLTDESITQRGELIKDSFSMIKSHPIFGVGLNNFLVELPSVHKQDANVFYLQPVHNIYLLILSQTGIVGLAFFVWFLIKTYRFINHKSYILILLTLVLTLGMFDHYFLTLQQGQLLFSFILGLCWADSSKKELLQT